MTRKIVIIVLAFWGILALFAEFIANDDPILYRTEGAWHCGTCQEFWNDTEYKTPPEAKAWLSPLIPYDASTLEPAGNLLLPPLTKGSMGTHLLGTDSQSRDVLAGIIHGSRYALLIALLSCFFSALIGILLGVLAGFYGNRDFKIRWWVMLLWILGIAYIIFVWSQKLMAPFFALFCLFIMLILPLLIPRRARRGISVPLDTLVSKGIEVLDSLPALFVLLAWIASVPEWNVVNLSFLIAFFTWPTFARLSRVEINKWKKGDWVKSLQSLNMPDRWIISNQLLGLILTPLTVHAAFIAAASVSIEASLSFLGFGLGAEIVSWGSLLNEARQFFHAWWLVVFPGISLFSLLWAFNEFAKFMQKRSVSSQLEPEDQIL